MYWMITSPFVDNKKSPILFLFYNLYVFTSTVNSHRGKKLQVPKV